MTKGPDGQRQEGKFCRLFRLTRPLVREDRATTEKYLPMSGKMIHSMGKLQRRGERKTIRGWW